MAYPSWQELADWVIKFGFAVAVAIYLLVKTTNAIDRLANETMKLRQSIEGTAKEVQREATEIRDDIRRIVHRLPVR